MSKISSFQLALSVAAVLQGAYIFLNGFILQTGQQAPLWIALSLIAAFFCLFIYFKAFKFESLFSKHKNTAVKIILWLYVLFFVLLCIYNVSSLSTFINGYILDETPKTIFALLFVLVCAFAAHGGERGIIKLSAVFFFIAAVSDLINVFLLRDKFNMDNFLPIISGNTMAHAGTSLSGAVALLGDVAVFASFTAFGEKGKRRAIVWGYILGAFFVLLTVLRSVAALGNTAGIFTWPTFEALRMIDSRNNLSRIETGSVFVILSTMFFKVSIIFCAALRGIKKLCHLKKDTVPIAFLTVAVIIGTNVLFSSDISLLSFATKYGAIFMLPFALVFPLYFCFKKKKNSDS